MCEARLFRVETANRPRLLIAERLTACRKPVAAPLRPPRARLMRFCLGWKAAEAVDLLPMPMDIAFFALESLGKDFARGSHFFRCGVWNLRVLPLFAERVLQSMRSALRPLSSDLQTGLACLGDLVPGAATG